MKTKHLVSSIAATVLLAAGTAQADRPAIGSNAPDFSLPDATGKSVNLAEFKGKYVVLEWTNPGCPFVQKHYSSGNMQKLQSEFTKKGVVWLTVDSSAPGQQGSFNPTEAKAAKDDLYKDASDLLLDPDGTVGHLYGATNTPDMYIISPEGKLIYEGAIDSIASADKADLAKATNYVQASLDDALAGKPIEKAETKPYGCSVKYKK
jgi:peroxiredoxin